MIIMGLYYPNGKENSFYDELAKTDSMSPDEIHEWLQKDTVVTNDEIVRTASVNYVAGRMVGGIRAVVLIGVGFAVYKIGKYIYKRIKTKITTKNEGK